MAVRGLSYYPEEVLLHPSQPVTQFTPELHQLLRDMFDTMYAAHGVGLAAPQIGIARRVFVMDCGQQEKSSSPLAVVNPEILWAEGEQEDYEGCLSIPGYSFKVLRPTRVGLKGQDLDGNQFRYEATGLEARCVLHETDHCNGLLYFRRLTPLRRQELLRKLKKRIKDGTWPSPMQFSL